MINSKEQIIEYFKSGIKNTKDFKIGIEHEKFLFNNQDNKDSFLIKKKSKHEGTLVEKIFICEYKCSFFNTFT